MPAWHGCRKVPVAPHRVRGRLTHSPPGPSPPVSSILSPLSTLSSQLSTLTLLALISHCCLFTPLPRRLCLVLSVSLCDSDFCFTSAAVSLSLFHPVEMQPYIPAKDRGQQDLVSRTNGCVTGDAAGSV